MNESFNQDDFNLGAKVIGYATQAFAFGISLAIAWSCSSVMFGILMFIVMSLLLGLLAGLLNLVILFKMPSTSIASVGHTVGGAAAKVTGWFSRTPIAA